MEEKIKPVMLWGCPHLVLRYEEVPLFIEAGAEVIPGFGDRNLLAFDRNYDDESNELYPNWRSYCSLPTHIVEKIRRIRIDTPTEEEVAFMNKWVDAIYIASFPDLVSKVLKWYKGIVVFRVFGGFKSYAEICQIEDVDLSAFEQTKDRYIWSPILKSLSSIEDVRLVQNETYIPAFVSRERLPFKWMREDSDRIISTAIPYIHHSELLYSIFRMFADAFTGIDFVVLGKNDKSSKHCEHPSILGNVDFNTLWSRLCRSRLFCYGGYMTPYHLHFTPLEAITIGVPTLFLKQSGLTSEALEYGLRDEELRNLGMCDDLKEMRSRSEQLMDNLDQLNELQQMQHERLLPVFSRNRALDNARSLIRKILEHAIVRRKDCSSLPVLPSLYSDPEFTHNLINYFKLPAVAGEYRIWDARQWEGLTGTTEWVREYNVYARLGRHGIDLPGLLVNDRLDRLEPGKYKVVVRIKTDKISTEPDTYFQLGAFVPDYTNFTTFPLHQPDNMGLIVVQDIFTVPNLPASAIIYMQISWMGRQSISILRVRLRKLSDESLPLPSSPLTFRWRNSFSFLENDVLRNFRWCGTEGVLEIENHSSVTKTIEVCFGIEAALPEASTWSVSSELWCESISIHGEETVIRRIIAVAPGTHIFKMHCDGNELPVSKGTRSLVFRINNFHYEEIPC